MISFFDEVTGASNPLPPGIFVNVYGGTTIGPSTFVGSGYTTIGGNLEITLQTNTVYSASFIGVQAPTLTVQFETDVNGDALAVNVTGYRSPSLSANGYALEHVNLQPTSLWNPTAATVGGNAYPFSAGAGGVLSALDVLIQACRGKMRLQTSPGSEFELPFSFNNLGGFDSSGLVDQQYTEDAIDTWAQDFFGGLFQRQPNMSDAQWLALIQGTLQTPKLTLVGIQKILTLWWPWILAQAGNPPAGLGIGLDTYGALDVPTAALDEPGGTPNLANRNLLVFDTQAVASSSGLTENVTLASYLPLSKGYVCIYLQNPNNSDSSMGQISSPSSLLTLIVNAWKSSGVLPIYAEN